MRKPILLKKALCVLCASVFVFLCGLALAGAQAGTGGVNTPEQREKPYLILVSLDGFRADYLDRFRLPNLGRVMKRGARAKWMNPVFPSLTFPNHYSLVTGLYPEKHGIVGNSFYDPARRQSTPCTRERRSPTAPGTAENRSGSPPRPRGWLPRATSGQDPKPPSTASVRLSSCLTTKIRRTTSG